MANPQPGIDPATIASLVGIGANAIAVADHLRPQTVLGPATFDGMRASWNSLIEQLSTIGPAVADLPASIVEPLKELGRLVDDAKDNIGFCDVCETLQQSQIGELGKQVWTATIREKNGRLVPWAYEADSTTGPEPVASAPNDLSAATFLTEHKRRIEAEASARGERIDASRHHQAEFVEPWEAGWKSLADTVSTLYKAPADAPAQRQFADAVRTLAGLARGTIYADWIRLAATRRRQQAETDPTGRSIGLGNVADIAAILSILESALDDPGSVDDLARHLRIGYSPFVGESCQFEVDNAEGLFRGDDDATSQPAIEGDFIERLLAGPNDAELSDRDFDLLEAHIKQRVSLAQMQQEARAGTKETVSGRNKLRLIRDFNLNLRKRAASATSNSVDGTYPPPPVTLADCVARLADDLEREAEKGASHGRMVVDPDDSFKAAYVVFPAGERWPATVETLAACRNSMDKCPQGLLERLSATLNKVDGITKRRNARTIEAAQAMIAALVIDLGILAAELLNYAPSSAAGASEDRGALNATNAVAPVPPSIRSDGNSPLTRYVDLLVRAPIWLERLLDRDAEAVGILTAEPALDEARRRVSQWQGKRDFERMTGKIAPSRRVWTRRDERRVNLQRGLCGGYWPACRAARYLARLAPRSGPTVHDRLFRQAVDEARRDGTAAVLCPLLERAHGAFDRMVGVAHDLTQDDGSRGDFQQAQVELAQVAAELLNWTKEPLPAELPASVTATVPPDEGPAVNEQTESRRSVVTIDKLERDTPPLDKSNGQNWARASELRSHKETPSVKSLREQRSAGKKLKLSNGTFGVCKAGRIWRKKEKERDVWYYVPSLLPIRDRTEPLIASALRLISTVD